ncbi:hypothetical protein PSYPI_47066, partial [Pseudomonas syringae pv. pisi str. 1704B]
ELDRCLIQEATVGELNTINLISGSRISQEMVDHSQAISCTVDS